MQPSFVVVEHFRVSWQILELQRFAISFGMHEQRHLVELRTKHCKLRGYVGALILLEKFSLTQPGTDPSTSLRSEMCRAIRQSRLRLGQVIDNHAQPFVLVPGVLNATQAISAVTV